MWAKDATSMTKHRLFSLQINIIRGLLLVILLSHWIVKSHRLLHHHSHLSLRVYVHTAVLICQLHTSCKMSEQTLLFALMSFISILCLWRTLTCNMSYGFIIMWHITNTVISLSNVFTNYMWCNLVLVFTIRQHSLELAPPGLNQL